MYACMQQPYGHGPEKAPRAALAFGQPPPLVFG